MCCRGFAARDSDSNCRIGLGPQHNQRHGEGESLRRKYQDRPNPLLRHLKPHDITQNSPYAISGLVLNGDTVDEPGGQLSPEDQQVLELIRQQSFIRTVVWLEGNHEKDYRLAETNRIHYRKCLLISNRLLLVHGDDFDQIQSRNQWFVHQFAQLHCLCVKLGAAPVHVAQFAKRTCPILYRVLTRSVRIKAVGSAIAKDVAAITCGHTHTLCGGLCRQRCEIH
jgi:hypothetical protein